jgi:hypothetical protein
MSPEAKAAALKGEFDPRPIEQAMKILPRKELIRYGLLDPQFTKGFRRGFKESVYRRYPGLRPRPTSPFPGEVRGASLRPSQFPPIPQTARERVTYRGYTGRPALSREEATFPPLPKTRRGRPTRVDYHYYYHGFPAIPGGPRPAIPHYGPPSSVTRGFTPFSTRAVRASKSSKYGGFTESKRRRKAIYEGEPISDSEEKSASDARYYARGYDPDHLGDLIHEAEERGFPPDYIQELIERDRWIDEKYGPLNEYYGELARRGEYDPAKKKRRSAAEQPRETMMNYMNGTTQTQLQDPASDEGQDWPDTWSDPTRRELDQEYRMRRDHVRGPVMSLPEFQKRWQDPNQRYKLKKLRAIFDPRTRHVIQLHRNLKAKDPGKYPEPIDIHGYADRHAGVMLRLVPEVHGLSPKDLEGMNPYRGGYVKITPKGSLVEIQAKYPAHQFDNDILPRMIQDPTNEIDLKHGRIVRRGKANIATNIFLDRENR